MDRLPVKDGRSCIFRVVRVSGTIRKVEEEAIRRAKLLVLAAKDEMAGKASSDALNALFRGGKDSARSLALVNDDHDDAEMDEGEVSDG